jgi:acetoin:2,6-dichlorophenolindophenol oxidoreductase subunit alpha
MTSVPSIERYAAMLQMRHFDEACLEGVPTLEIHGELHTGIGQEAIGAGMVGQLRDDDAVVSTHRNHYHAIAKGVPLRALLAEIYEKETGLCRGRGGHMHPFDPERAFSATGIVGASLPVALGYAYTFWLRGADNVAVGITGDGGSNHGTFHECLNIAGAWRLPFVVLVENNNIAISVPFDQVSATETVAQRAQAYGAWGRRVDGTDLDAVAEGFAEAVAHARGGRGPALLEASCFRFRGHYEGDHDSYRDRKERKRMQLEYDPIVRYRAKLIATGVAGEATLAQLEAESKARMQTLLAEVRQDRMPDAAGALDYRFLEAGP